MEQDYQSIHSACNRFGLKLLQAFTRDGSHENIFFSPLSISMCLTIATNGASNQTRHEMQQALCLAEFSLDEINRANQYLIRQFNVSEGDTNDEPEPQPSPDDIILFRKRRIPRNEMENAYRVLDIISNTPD